MIKTIVSVGVDREITTMSSMIDAITANKIKIITYPNYRAPLYIGLLHDPCVVVFDTDLDEQNPDAGIETLRQLRKKCPSLPIVIITSRCDIETLQELDKLANFETLDQGQLVIKKVSILLQPFDVITLEIWFCDFLDIPKRGLVAINAACDTNQ